jgi:glutathione S-transferase
MKQEAKRIAIIFAVPPWRKHRGNAPMNIVLYDWAPSPFCMKVRAILDYKGLAYTRLDALAHARKIKGRGGIGKVPAVEIDGAMTVDSTDIAYLLEQRCPNPSILPSAPRDRAFCHVLEDWTDESLYFTGLYYHWFEPSGREQVRRVFSRSLIGHLAYYRLLPTILRQLRGHGTSRKPPEHVRRDLGQTLDAIETMLHERQYLLADQPMLCDFALMSQLVYIQRSPRGAEVLAPRAGIQTYLDRMRALRAAR